MRRKGEAKEEQSAAWSESEEGRRHHKWLDVWDEFEQHVLGINIGHPDPIKPPRTPLSAMIAALPRRPADIDSADVPRAVADRSIPPQVQADVRESWRRIDAWLAEHAPNSVSQMHEGATLAAIADAERALCLELPDAVRASYTVHNGSAIMSLFPSGEYLTLEQMLSIVDPGIWTTS